MKFLTNMSFIKRHAVVLFIVFFSININQCYAVSVGDSYGGGTVFCVSQTPDLTQCVPTGSGSYGLIMADEDQVNFYSNPDHGVIWASKTNKIIDARSDDEGRANTAAVVATHSKDGPDNNAAWVCHNYRDKGEGHDDWYLPAKNELKKMYWYAKAHKLIGIDCVGSKPDGIQCLIGGAEGGGIYWSSTESSSYFSQSCAWFQSLSGEQNFFSKVGGHLGVRAIRAFINSPIHQFNSFLAKYPVSVALAVMAQDPTSDLECLKFVYGHAGVDAAGLAAVARHRNVDVDLLRGVAGHPRSDATALLAVARNPLTNVAGLRAIVMNRNATQEVLAVVVAHPHADPDILLVVEQNPATDLGGITADFRRASISAHTRTIIAKRGGAAAPAAGTHRQSKVPTPARLGTARFTLEYIGAGPASVGNLTQLFPPDYQPPALPQVLIDADIPSPQQVFKRCDEVAACAVANGAVNCTRLTREDAATIAMYTFDFGDIGGGKSGNYNPYSLINRGLLERNKPQLHKLRGMIYKLLHALRSLQPIQPQTLYRGIRERVLLNDTHYHKGNKIVWHTFSSTTLDMETTKLFLTDLATGKCEGTLFIIRGAPWGYNIKPFSCFPEEEEILLEPEIELRVTGVLDTPMVIVNLDMVPDQRLLLESLIPRNVGAVALESPQMVVPVAAAAPRYIAIADWQSTIEEGLTFNKGDVIDIVNDQDKNWWVGELNGQRGWVPSSYLQPRSAVFS